MGLNLRGAKADVTTIRQVIGRFSDTRHGIAAARG
jgi:hypothetical protein